MKKTLKTLSLLLCLMLCFSLLTACNSGGSGGGGSSGGGGNQQGGGGAAEAEVLRVGMECEYAPYNWTQLTENEFTVAMPDGTFVDGYDVQIAKLVAAELGMELQIIKVDWDGLPPSLTADMIDLIIAGMTDTPDRRMAIDFTDIYWSSDMVIVVMRDGPFANAESLADFAGANITAQMDTLHVDLIDMIPGVNKLPAMIDFPTMLMSLASGIIDGYIAERPSAISAEISNPNVAFVEFDADKGFGEDVPVSIGLRQGEDELKARINEILAGISLEQRQQIMEDVVARQPLSAE